MTEKPSRFSNGDSESFWLAARDHRLELQVCKSCSHVQFPPRNQCAECWSTDIEPLQSSGKGVIESVSVVRRAPQQQFRDKVPYTVVSVRLDDGPRMITNLVGDGALDAQIGDPVSVFFEANENDEVLPQFRLVAKA